MSLFKDLEKTAEFYRALDNAETKITVEDLSQLTPLFEAPLNIITINDQDMIIEGDILGEHRANVRGENQSLLKRGQLVRYKGEKQVYRIVRNPKPVRLFNRTKIHLKLT